MRIKYFEDTDTALVEFSDQTTVETQELNENVYIDLDDKGRVVSITIEHVGEFTDMRELIYQRVPANLSVA